VAFAGITLSALLVTLVTLCTFAGFFASTGSAITDAGAGATDSAVLAAGARANFLTMTTGACGAASFLDLEAGMVTP
jgi:hypothetical protein